MRDRELSQYSRLIALRNILKEVQQLSWNITQLDKKFPIENAEDFGYDELINTYLEFGDSILSIADNFKEEKEKQN